MPVHKERKALPVFFKQHTDVNDPLLGSWLARMPVIPKAELHLWALVILKHSHHDRLEQREKSDRKAEN